MGRGGCNSTVVYSHQRPQAAAAVDQTVLGLRALRVETAGVVDARSLKRFGETDGGWMRGKYGVAAALQIDGGGLALRVVGSSSLSLLDDSPGTARCGCTTELNSSRASSTPEIARRSFAVTFSIWTASALICWPMRRVSSRFCRRAENDDEPTGRCRLGLRWSSAGVSEEAGEGDIWRRWSKERKGS